MSNAKEILHHLQRLGEGIEDVWYLFGGCSMTLADHKQTTKDVDAAIEGHLPQIAQDMEALGYDAWEDPWTIDNDNFAIFSKGDFRIDLFPQHRIFDGPGFTKSMKQRANEVGKFGGLTVRRADDSTIFLFKSMTGRWRKEPLRDLEDLVHFAEAGRLDWQWIQAEWDAFDGKGRVVEKVQEALAFLKGEGYFVGWRV